MSQGYVLSQASPWGYLVSVSAKDFEHKQVGVRLRFHSMCIDTTGVVADNYRPRFVLRGTVDAIEGELAPGVNSAQVDEPLELSVDYEPSNEEIAQLALKGFFSEQYPLQDVLLSPISIPCTVPILVFHGAETPVIQLALKSSDVVTANSVGIGRALVAEFPQRHEMPHMNHEPYLIEEPARRHSPNFSREVFLRERGLPVETSVKSISRERPEQDIQEVLDTTLAEMKQVPVPLAWDQSEESFAGEPAPTTDTVQIVSGIPDIFVDESEFIDDSGLELGE